jgi:transcriptional regulator with XRE-family HTH domain
MSNASTTAAILAANLRRLRVAARISLSELARATGAGKATLSDIENGRGNPTVDTLTTLARSLGVPVVELLAPPPAPPVTVVRAGAGEPAGDGLERLGRLALGEVQRGRFEARAEVEAAPLAPGSRLHVVVTRGALVAGPAEHISELGPGDYAAFPADAPYVFRTGPRAAEAVLVVERP